MYKAATGGEEFTALNEKNKSPFKIKHVLILSAMETAVIFVLHFVMLYAYNVWPFSDRVPSQYDLLAQIVPFAEHFFDVLNGEASIFYSYRVGGGMDVFGTVAYCLVSPFTFLFWVFGDGNVWQAAAVIIPAKLSCTAISALIMIKLCFPEMKKPVAFVLAIVYAYCGYVFVANTYINWMDFLIYLPLAVPAFLKMVREGKILWFSVIIACCIYTCFSITCFSMFISYPVLVCYAFLVVEKGERKNYLTKLSLSYICGVIAALPLMIPAFMSYISSGRNTGIFDSLWDDISAISYGRKLSYILSDTLFFVLAIVYFIKTKFRTKESRFAAVAGLMIMMPVLVDECCILMNMGSYMSYALRFGFLNALYGLVISCRVLESFSFKRKPRDFGRKLNESNPEGNNAGQSKAKVVCLKNVPAKKAVREGGTKVHVLNSVLPFAAAIFFLLLVAFGCFGIYQLAQTYSSSASSYAHSTGALELILYIFGVVGIITVIAAIIYACRLVPSKIIYVGMAAILTAQVILYGGMLVSGNVFNHIRYDQYSTLYSEIMEDEELEPYEFRVKDYANSLSDNQGFITNSASYSVFSSMASSDNFAFNEVFGMGGNGVNTLKSKDGNLLGNCLIGNKYYFYISESDDESGRPTLSYDYLEEVGSDTYFIMYENTLVFPSAFTVSGGDLNVVTDYDEYFDNMQNICEFLDGEGSVFNEYTFTANNIADVTATQLGTDYEGDLSVYRLSMKLPVSGDYTFCPDFPEDMEVQWYTGSYESSTKYDISQIKTFSYINATSRVYTIYLVGEELTKDNILEYCSYKAIAKDTVAELCESLWQRQVRYTMSSSLMTTTISTEVTTEEEGQYLFINYVALDGHTAYVNGKKVQMVENGLNMMVIPLEKGENTVVIEYNSPSIVQMAAGTVIAVVLLSLIAVFFCTQKGQLRLAKVNTLVSVASVVLACAVVAFFMVFPTVVFAVKLVKLIFL